ncbi:MAG: hypothetical protein JXB32_08570, partial [Deltaproteobacteria bacterium]|nr:hypothetical protein [Deltaproteobacteria bacterium]
MGATRATRCVLPAAAALAVAWAAGCSERTPVGDESVVSREPWTGGWYAECSELDCAQSCSSDGRTMRGECSWTGEALECRCIGRPAASCEAEPCA